MPKKIKLILLVAVGTVPGIILLSLAFNWFTYHDALDKSNAARQPSDCQEIPKYTYNTFLIFNPPNKQTYFIQSACYQNMAIETLDGALCDHVREHFVWGLDGSGISETACKSAVKDRLDRAAT